MREMPLHEIVLPTTKPETEWIDGQRVQKVSPTYRHALLQRRIATRLGDWADTSNTGRVGTEWRFRVGPPDEVVRPLVPDVAYLSYSAVAPHATEHDVAVPLAAPTVAVEILCADDREQHVRSKIATYLASGTEAVIVVDPDLLAVAVHDHAGVRVFAPDDVVTHRSMPGFELALGPLFARMD
jgi:Uma2 family endonuclease